MARRCFTWPIRFVCLTDQPESMPDGVEPIHIKPYPGLKGWWNKLQLWNPRHQLEGRVVYFDLDVLLVKRELDDLATFAEFALVPDGAPNFRPRGGLAVVKRFNSSVMSFEGGAHADLFEDWSPAVAARLWGDQDWIGERCPGATAMPQEWFPRISQIPHTGELPEGARVILVKKPKNLDAAQRWSWFRQAWA